MNESVELITAELCQAMLGSINDQFESVSFDINKSGFVQVRFILKSKTEAEQELIDDILTEFSALHGIDDIEKPEIFLSKEAKLRSHVVLAML